MSSKRTNQSDINKSSKKYYSNIYTNIALFLYPKNFVLYPKDLFQPKIMVHLK